MKLLTEDRSFYKSLVKLAIPVALQNLITFAVTFADNLMVGKLGDNAVSGVYMGGQIQTFLQLFSAGIEGALLILAAQYYGRGDRKNIKRITSIGLMCSVIVGIIINLVCAVIPSQIISIFTNEESVISVGAEYLSVVCFSYVFFCITQTLIASMRSVEVANIGMTVSFISLLTNVFLNYILIFGKLGLPALGVRGAAIATLISRIIECLIMIYYVFFRDRKLHFRFGDIPVINRILLKDFLRYGLPIVGGQLVWSINMMANSAIMGRYSESVITAVSVANTMNALAYVTMNGMSSAVGIITGKTIGAGKKELMKEYAKTVQILFLGLGLVTSLVITLLKKPFVSLYSGISAEAADFSAVFITVLSVTMIGTCYQAACLFGLVKSGGDISFVFRNDFIFVFFVVLPSAVIASKLGAPEWVVFACLKCDQILKCIVAFFKINSYNWMKNLTRDNTEITENEGKTK